MPDVYSNGWTIVFQPFQCSAVQWLGSAMTAFSNLLPWLSSCRRYVAVLRCFLGCHVHMVMKSAYNKTSFVHGKDISFNTKSASVCSPEQDSRKSRLFFWCRNHLSRLRIAIYNIKHVLCFLSYSLKQSHCSRHDKHEWLNYWKQYHLTNVAVFVFILKIDCAVF